VNSSELVLFDVVNYYTHNYDTSQLHEWRYMADNVDITSRQSRLMLS